VTAAYAERHRLTSASSSATGLRLWIMPARVLASATMIVHEASGGDGCGLTGGRLCDNLEPIFDLQINVLGEKIRDLSLYGLSQERARLAAGFR
jgi:hypothetical protein